jgi:hypothetical protein
MVPSVRLVRFRFSVISVRFLGSGSFCPGLLLRMVSSPVVSFYSATPPPLSALSPNRFFSADSIPPPLPGRSMVLVSSSCLAAGRAPPQRPWSRRPLPSSHSPTPPSPPQCSAGRRLLPARRFWRHGRRALGRLLHCADPPISLLPLSHGASLHLASARSAISLGALAPTLSSLPGRAPGG